VLALVIAVPAWRARCREPFARNARVAITLSRRANDHRPLDSQMAKAASESWSGSRRSRACNARFQGDCCTEVVSRRSAPV